MDFPYIASIVASLGAIAGIFIAHRLVGVNRPEQGGNHFDAGIEFAQDPILRAEVRQLRSLVLQLRAELNETRRENEEGRLRDLELERVRRRPRLERPVTSVRR